MPRAIFPEKAVVRDVGRSRPRERSTSCGAK